MLNEDSDKVLLVGANMAIKDYEKYAAHFSPANRLSQPSHHMAFYYKGKIDKRVPRILGIIWRIIPIDYIDGDTFPSIIKVTGEELELRRRFSELIEKMKSNYHPLFEERIKIILLTSDNDERTIHLASEILNDKLSKAGKIIRFVQSQRYVSLKKLKTARRTSELEES